MMEELEGLHPAHDEVRVGALAAAAHSIVPIGGYAQPGGGG